MRSASNSWQMSRETSRMISSTLVVEWMRFVTAWIFFEKASFTLMSATLPDEVTLGSRTALMVAPAVVECCRCLYAGNTRLEREFLVVLEHPRPPAARRLAHFLHRQRPFAGLQVRDVHLRRHAHLLELLGEHPGAQLLGGERDVALLVRKGRFDDQVLQVGRAVDRLPQRLVARGVAAEDERAACALQRIAHRGHGVIGGNCRLKAPRQLHYPARHDLAIHHERVLRARDLRETGPDLPVEQGRRQDG